VRNPARSWFWSVSIFIGAAAAFLDARPAAAQYTVQVLVAPDGISPDARTDPYAMNNKGQVFGQVFVTAQDRRPLLWTAGQAEVLSVPAPYVWDGGNGGHQFLNDHGAAVGQVLNPDGLPRHPTLDQPLVVEWTRSGTQMVAQIVPLPPVVSCASDYALAFGFNNNGHVLIESGDAEGTCHRLWLWDGTGGTASAFTEVANLGDPLPGCPASYAIRPGASHLNDADHVALEFSPGTANPPCSPTFESGILANGVFTPLTTSTAIGGASQINNADQVVMGFDSGSGTQVQFWDGSTLENLGFVGGVWMNDLGHLLFTSGTGTSGTLQTRKNGVTTNVTVPAIPDFFEPAGGISSNGINTTGQLLIGGAFHMGGPSGNLTSHPILLTPPAPTATLKVNGQHPTPTPVVATNGPMLLTLDMSNPSDLYTGPLAWYFGVIVNNQVVWITATGPSATPAPLATLPPFTFTNAVLINTSLPPATTLTSFLLLVDVNSNALTSFDIIAAARP